MNSTDSGAGDLYEMLTYLLVIIISAFVMIVWLKRKNKRKQQRKG